MVVLDGSLMKLRPLMAIISLTGDVIVHFRTNFKLQLQQLQHKIKKQSLLGFSLPFAMEHQKEGCT
jgi:hypothetical protein